MKPPGAGAGGDAQLLDLHPDAGGPLGDHAAVEGQLLRLARHLRLQLAHGARHFRLLVRAPDAEGVQLRQLGAHLAVGLLQVLDAHLELGALLGDRLAVVAGVVAAELVDDIAGEQADQHRGHRQRGAPHRGARPHHLGRAVLVAEHARQWPHGRLGPQSVDSGTAERPSRSVDLVPPGGERRLLAAREGQRRQLLSARMYTGRLK